MDHQDHSQHHHHQHGTGGLNAMAAAATLHCLTGCAVGEVLGLVLGTALEVALKIEETCLRPVRGYSYADLRHGPISVVGEGVTALLAAAPDGPLVHGMTELARDLRERGADVVGIGGDDAFAAACDLAVVGPDLPEVLAPLGLVVPAQLATEDTFEAKAQSFFSNGVHLP